MDPAHALLDRELLISGILHDLRGPLTAVQGWAELEEERGSPAVTGALTRVRTLLDGIADPTWAAPADAVFAGARVRVRGPIDVLKIAVDDLPHERIEVVSDGERVDVRIDGVPAAEIPQGWSMAQVRRWLEEGGPGLAGARVRIAARVVGAVRQHAALAPGSAHGSVTISLVKG